MTYFRRFVWNYFRLENEHLNNCGQFRAVRDISIAPIDSNDQSQLEEMMDDEDGEFVRSNERSRLLSRKYVLCIFGIHTTTVLIFQTGPNVWII